MTLADPPPPPKSDNNGIMVFTKPNIVSGWLYQTKTHITHIVYQPFSRVTPPNYIALAVILNDNKKLKSDDLTL